MTYRCFLLAGCLSFLLFGCSHDPNIRKQKYLESGKRYFDKGDYPRATIQFSNALQGDARFTEAHYRLAQAYLKMQDWGHAYHELSRTLELAPDYPSARIDLANLLIDAGEFQQAREHADYLAAHQGGDARVHVILAKLRLANQDFAGAAQELQAAIAIDPNAYEPYLDLAQLQVRTNQFAAAEENFKKAVALESKTTVSRVALGNFYQSQKRSAEAEQQFRQAMAADAKSPDPRAALVRLYMEHNDRARAVEILRQTKKDLSDDSSGYRMLGDFYFANGEIDNALEEYASLYQDHSKDLRVKKNYIQLLLLKSRFEDARKLNDEVLKGAPADVDGLIYRAQLQMHDGHVGEAITTLQSAIHNDPDNGVAHYHLGNAYATNGNLRQAESAWADAVRLRPDLVEGYRALASSALRRGDMEALAAAATQIIALQPAQPDGYALRALSLTSKKQFADAAKDAAKAVEFAPASPAGYVQLGNVQLAQKHYDDAEKYFQQALGHDPASTDALQSLAQVYLLENKPDKAIVAVKNQIAKIPTDGSLYSLLGGLLAETRDWNGAQGALQKALELNPHDVRTILKLAQVQSFQGRGEEALKTCQRALQENPREAGALVLQGQLYDAQHQDDRAKESYRQALQIAPDDPLASNNLAYSLLETGGNLDVAISLAQAARRGLPNSYSAADTLGWAFYQKGIYRSAIDLFQESLKLEAENRQADDPAVHYHLGLAYEKSGQHARARQELERALHANPPYAKSDDVRRTLAQMQK